MDYPTCGYFEDFMRLYPNAKVLLTCRDSPEAWVNSANDTIMKVAYESWFAKGILYHTLKKSKFEMHFESHTHTFKSIFVHFFQILPF